MKIANLLSTLNPGPARGAAVALLALAMGAAACGGGTPTSSLGPSASPSPSAGQGRGTVAGTVASFNGTTLVLNERSGGTVTITTSASTVVMKTQGASVSDILPNDRVVVTGPAGVAGSVTATAIVLANPAAPGSGTGGGGFGRPGGGRFRRGRTPRPTPTAGARRGIAGTVSFIQGSTLTVKTASGSSVQVATTPSTTVVQTVGAALSDITTGEVCRVSGTKNADGSYNAIRIVISAAGSAPAQLG